MKKVLYLAACAGLVSLMSGCGSRDYACSNPFKNRPLRTKMQSWCHGDACDTCNIPAGQPTNCDTNVAPLCDTCGSGDPVPAIQLYNDPNLNAPMGTPVPTQGIETPAPDYSGSGVQFQNGVTPAGNDTVPTGSGVANFKISPPTF